MILPTSDPDPVRFLQILLTTGTGSSTYKIKFNKPFTRDTQINNLNKNKSVSINIFMSSFICFDNFL